MSQKNRVHRYQADRTNQKLYFCRLACQQAEQAKNKQLYQAQCETAVFHLYGAVLAFLQELSQFYGLNLPSPTLTSIEEQLAVKTQVSPEIIRLKQSSEKGVLAEIEAAYQRCQYMPKLTLSEPTNSPHDLIVNVVTLSEQWLPDDGIIRQWRDSLLTLIEQLRAGMLEY